DTPLVRRAKATGPLVYRVASGGRVVWANSLAYDGTGRSVPRPGEKEHSIQPASPALIPLRLPLDGDAVPADLDVQLLMPGEGVNADAELLDAAVQRRASVPTGVETVRRSTAGDLAVAQGVRYPLAAAGVRFPGPTTS